MSISELQLQVETYQNVEGTNQENASKDIPDNLFLDPEGMQALVDKFPGLSQYVYEFQTFVDHASLYQIKALWNEVASRPGNPNTTIRNFVRFSDHDSTEYDSEVLGQIRNILEQYQDYPELEIEKILNTAYHPVLHQHTTKDQKAWASRYYFTWKMIKGSGKLQAIKE